ncbi:MAG: hypothetical protein AABY83_03075 [Pseudomonadota bacterium]
MRVSGISGALPQRVDAKSPHEKPDQSAAAGSDAVVKTSHPATPRAVSGQDWRYARPAGQPSPHAMRAIMTYERALNSGRDETDGASLWVGLDIYA